MAESRAIIISEIGVKARSKKEVYMILTVEWRFYLPPMEDASQVYFNQILIGKKKYILWKNLKVFISSSCEEVESEWHIIICIKLCWYKLLLPEYNYKKDPQREWLCNIVNTLIHSKIDVLAISLSFLFRRLLTKYCLKSSKKWQLWHHY